MKIVILAVSKKKEGWCVVGKNVDDESRDEEQDYGAMHRRNRKAEGVLEAS